MKVFMITEAEFHTLRLAIERVKLRKVEMLESHDPEKQQVNDIFRSFNYEVCNWISEMSK